MRFSRLAFLACLTTALFAQEVSGSYAGTITIEEDGSSRAEKGLIIIKESAGTLTISAGPTPSEQYTARNIQRDGASLKFEVTAGVENPHLLKFDVSVRDTTLSGTVTSHREGKTRTLALEFKKQ
ncbi:MAG: hypothetical protein IPJ98_14615 [Bryobacterales bacterium]|nr:hypothetical protein [Bryobacterales bacterium]